MDPLSIVLLISGLVAAGGTSFVVGKRIVDKFRAKTADNKHIGDLLVDALEIWNEEKEEIAEVISQFMVASKAIDKQAGAVDKINQNVELRKKLLETAATFSPETASELAAALTPVPAEFQAIGGAHLDKLTKIKDAQREELSKKEATNKMLERTNEMAHNIIGAIKIVAPLIPKK